MDAISDDCDPKPGWLMDMTVHFDARGNIPSVF